MAVSVAVIGSFKQHYDAVLSAIAAFRNAGWTVTSPAGTAVREPGIDFVRFVTDDAGDTDALVQTRTLINIFSADLTYVVAPNGYVGRTTCYEIGRLVQAGKPIFLSQPPFDLPIFIPPDFVCTPDELINRVRVAGGTQWPFASGTGLIFDLERRLLNEA